MEQLSTYEGTYIPSASIFHYALGVSALELKAVLEGAGLIVVAFGDTGRNGWCETECGWHVSTNGYVSQASADKRIGVGVSL